MQGEINLNTVWCE